jgi:acetyltransferase-like isoleucine patch superfamily enzyme
VKPLFCFIVVLLPWSIKRRVLEKFWGYDIAESSRIGLSYIFPGHLKLEAGARIGHLNVAVHLESLVCGENSRIGRSNWITGHERSGRFFSHLPGRSSSFSLGAESAVTKSHIFDCSDSISIGSFTTVAGYGSQFITHGIDLASSKQSCDPIDIGSFCLVSTRVTVVGGAILPCYSQLAAGSVLTSRLDVLKEYSLYGGSPAKWKKNLDPDSRYFHRESGFVN